MIHYLKHHQIDKVKWDICIENSSNSLVYGLSWYLDIVCENWDALILDDYKAVMPLPWKQKFGLKYIYHPFFAQQLGVFSQSEDNFSIVNFLQKIPKRFIKYECSLNASNICENIKVDERLNLILKLDKPYEDISKQFNTNTKRNIKKNMNAGWTLKNDISVSNFLQLKKENPVSELNKSNFKTLELLFNTLLDKNLAQIIGITDTENTLISAAIFVTFKNRIIYLFSASANTGKSNSSMFKIINQVIKANCESNQLIDFEGSMIPGVARFFKGFGAIEEFYFKVSSKHIPFI